MIETRWLSPVPEEPRSRLPVTHEDAAFARSGRVEHIVVLMLENRSFDQMLGYLSLPGQLGGRGRTDIDGLQPGMQNTHNGADFEIKRLSGTTFPDKDFDPDHSGWAVDEQIANNCGGYVSNYARTRTRELPFTHDELATVMGYYDGDQVYAFDYISSNFCVCDAWFCSTPGATLPNRLYAATGRAARSRNNSVPPVYSIPSIVRHLDRAGRDWAWFSHTMFATLWALDLEYAARNPVRAYDHFQFFDEETRRRAARLRRHLVKRVALWLLDKIRGWFGRRKEEAPTDLSAEPPVSLRTAGDTFISLAKEGRLPAVSFIDPLFIDLGDNFQVTTEVSNDDHPPSDVELGQKLVDDVLTAVMEGPAWEQTLVLITYDEHGGFFDHVPPPGGVPDCDPDPQFHRLGPRIPALVVSPWVKKQSVSSVTYDHTSILKTILTRFCIDQNNTIPSMGERVDAANHVLPLLDAETPQEIDTGGLEELKRRAAETPHITELAEKPSLAAEAKLSDLQTEMLAAQTAVMLAMGDPRSLTGRLQSALRRERASA